MPSVTSFNYDYDDRLVKITYADGKVIEFGYDGIGRRAWRKEGNIMRNFFYDGDKIIAEREGNAWVCRYLVSLSPCGFVVNGVVRIYHADRLGSVRFVTDSSQNILVSYVYEGFGKLIAQNGGGGGPYQFCGLWGYRNDWDAGLLHIGARSYEPEVGRWGQADELLGDILRPRSLNRYTYCENAPTIYVDPTGCFPWKVLLVLAVAALLTGCGKGPGHPPPRWEQFCPKCGGRLNPDGSCPSCGPPPPPYYPPDWPYSGWPPQAAVIIGPEEIVYMV